MNGYVCFFQGKRIEIKAASLYAAKLAAVETFKAGISDWHCGDAAFNAAVERVAMHVEDVLAARLAVAS